jgi:hypothetical protein
LPRFCDVREMQTLEDSLKSHLIMEEKDKIVIVGGGTDIVQRTSKALNLTNDIIFNRY